MEIKLFVPLLAHPLSPGYDCLHRCGVRALFSHCFALSRLRALLSYPNFYSSITVRVVFDCLLNLLKPAEVCNFVSDSFGSEVTFRLVASVGVMRRCGVW